MVGSKRAAAVCVLLLGVVTGWVSGAEALPCADYVSTGQNDAPGVGQLVGTETITYTLSVEPGGIGATVTTTFEVGIYDFGNGNRVWVDCRDYTLFE